MANFNSRLAKSLKVFTKIQTDLEKLIVDATNRAATIDSEIDVLRVERNEVAETAAQAAKIKAKIFDIVGDDA